MDLVYLFILVVNVIVLILTAKSFFTLRRSLKSVLNDIKKEKNIDFKLSTWPIPTRDKILENIESQGLDEVLKHQFCEYFELFDRYRKYHLFLFISVVFLTVSSIDHFDVGVAFHV